jgi:hypothetical protein
MSKRLVADADSSSKRQRTDGLDTASSDNDPRSAGFRRWILVYLCVALQCDTPILEALHQSTRLRLGDYVEAISSLLAWRWRMVSRGAERKGDVRSDHVWRRGDDQVVLTITDTRHQQELYIAFDVCERNVARLRLCCVRTRWFIGHRANAPLPNASLPMVLRWIQEFCK